jgi:hypothetical protein
LTSVQKFDESPEALGSVGSVDVGIQREFRSAGGHAEQ